MSIIQKEFVRRVLREEGERLTRNQGMAISKKLKFRTGRLMNGRTTEVVQADGMDGKLRFTHPDYERFLDMKRIVRRTKSVTVRQRENKGRRRSVASGGLKKKSGYGIHNRFIFGHYFSIANRLMYEFTEDVQQSIREELSNNG